MNDQALFAYLFVIDSSQMPLGEALNKVDKLREVENWQTILPDAAVLVSRLGINDLHRLLKTKLLDQKYLLTLLDRGKKAGWLAKDSWTFMNKPTSVFE